MMSHRFYCDHDLSPLCHNPHDHVLREGQRERPQRLGAEVLHLKTLLVVEWAQGLAEDTPKVVLRATLEVAVDREVLGEPAVGRVSGRGGAND